jgi:hypothetical protein
MLNEVARGKGGLYVIHYEHDDWCRTLITNRGVDCNCNPDIGFERIKGA